MQSAKNTFYITLRDRLAALNPNRTIYLRGITRPGIFVESNELVTARPPSNAFVLRWTGLRSDPFLPEVMLQMQCEVFYVTEGTTANLGMDRGAMLTEMDAELIALLQPTTAQKMNYSGPTPTPMETKIFWTEPTFAPVEVKRDSLSRTATIFVFSYEELGEQ